jgi:hypothetical protein
MLPGAGVRFSDGNLASASARHGEDARFLRSLDFQDIYHDGPMGLGDRSRLTARRQAEIIVPGALGLEALVHVATRSAAERRTLLTLLSKEHGSSAVAPEMITVDSGLFFCQWTYIESVALVGSTIRCQFNPDSQTPGPFAAVFEWADPATGASMPWPSPAHSSHCRQERCYYLVVESFGCGVRSSSNS